MIHACKLPFLFDPARLQADVARLSVDAWVPHFNKPYYEGEWSGIALRSVGGMDGRLYPDPTAQTAYADTPTLEHCSYVQEVLTTFACSLEAVRFLKLRAGSHIREHRDYNLGYEDGEIRVHVPVITNDAVAFYLNGERVKMEEGECWYVNTNLPHHVVNNSATDRIHLVIDCVVNDWVHDLFASQALAPV